MVTMPDFGFDGVSLGLEFMSIFFPNFFFFFSLCNPDTTDNRQHTSCAGCVVQHTGDDAIHACRLPAEQKATPHAFGSLSAPYYCGVLLIVDFVIGPWEICRPAGLGCCVIHACRHENRSTDISQRGNIISYAYDTISHAER